MSTKRRGLERVAFDLHVHTPASPDWQGGHVSANDLVAHAVTTGLEGIAVTDHGSGDWVDLVKAAATGTHLVVFPGVELNNLAGNEGIHLICLFETDVTSADIDRFLTTIGVLRGAGERRERGTATKGILEILDELERFPGIAVLAHCQSSKGALGAMRGDLRTRLVQHPAVLAAEAPAEDFHDQQKRSQHKRVYDLLDGSDEIYRRELAVYQASDNPSGQGHGHTLAGIGSRFSYFYVERPISLESLRQCFVDRAARIELPEPGAAIGANGARPAPGIARLRVVGGFLDGLDLEFHDGLTTILGPKGAGKSIIVELLRFALDQEPTQPEIRKDHDTKLVKRLGLYGRVIVTARLADGSEQTLEREHNPASDNPYHGATLPANELLPCHFLSQGEIVRVAESEDEQIRFIDSFFDFRTHQRGIDDVREQLRGLDHEVANQIRARKSAAALKAEQKTLGDEIAAKDAELKSPVFAKFQQAQAKTQALERAAGAISDASAALNQGRSALEAVPGPPQPEGALAADPAVRRALELAERAKRETLQRIADAIDAVTVLAGGAKHEQETWQPTYAATADEYSREIQKAGGDVPGLSQARARLVTKLAEVETKLHAVEQQAALLRPTVERRKELLEHLRQRQEAYTHARQTRCDWFEQKSEGQIKARVAAASNREDFRARLSAMKKGSYLTADQIDAIVAACSPDEFVNSLLRYDLSRNPADLDGLANASGLARERLVALAEFLLGEEGVGYESLLELQYAVTPTDRPEIAFRRDDGSYAPLDELSTGQKCTALLIMALCEGDAPIVVDQPEDSLDIRSIWDDMCRRLRLSKRGRQFVFTTHNSSLAVASDSDKFVVLTADAQHAEVVLSGAIDSEDVAQGSDQAARGRHLNVLSQAAQVQDQRPLQTLNSPIRPAL
jgi:ABC-type Mn2+/Zn2+ transport system ATPase subunit